MERRSAYRKLQRQMGIEFHAPHIRKFLPGKDQTHAAVAGKAGRLRFGDPPVHHRLAAVFLTVEGRLTDFEQVKIDQAVQHRIRGVFTDTQREYGCTKGHFLFHFQKEEGQLIEFLPSLRIHTADIHGTGTVSIGIQKQKQMLQDSFCLFPRSATLQMRPVKRIQILIHPPERDTCP